MGVNIVLPGLLAAAFFSDTAAEMQVEVSPRKITVGDPIDVVISTGIPPGSKLILPAPESFAPAEVIKTDTLKSDGQAASVRYTVSVYQTGRVKLPDLPLIFNRADGADTVWAAMGSVEVASVLNPADTSADIRDIKPPVKLAWTFRELLPYILLALAVIALGVAGYLLWRRHRRKLGLEPVYTPPPKPPYELALQRLEELRIKKLWQSGYLKEYYSELTEIVKEYIGGRFGLNAPEMTTADLLDCRSRWQVDDESYSAVRRMLTGGDLVKFARFKPDPHENDRRLDAAFALLEATKPRPALETVTETADSELESA
jgi:hypothetical protein